MTTTTPVLLALATVLTFFALPNAHAEPTFGCHSWEVFVGDPEQGVGASPDDGALFAGAAGFYVVSDGDPLRNDFIFSIWVYQESNDSPGLQRQDEVCDETDGRWDGDAGCFC